MSEWPTVSLRDVADIRFSNVDKKITSGEPSVRLCNYMDVYGNDYITADLPFMVATASFNEIGRFSIQQGDVMITKDSETPDDIGIAAVVTEEIPNLVCGYHLALIKPDKSRIDPVYLSKQLGTPSVVNHFACRASGSTRYGLSSATIAHTKLPLAPLPQQRRIAEILGTVDEVIEQTEALIAKQQQVKAGLMHDLFTRGVTATGTLRPPPAEAPHLYQDSPLGPIPNEWAVMKCSEVCDKITVGIVVRPTQYYVNEGVPAFRSANVRETGIDPTDFVFISHEANELLAKSQLKAGDVVSVRTGYPGTTAVVPPEFEGANCIDILISRPTSRIDSHFMAAWINSSFGKDQVLKKQGGLAQQHFNVGDLRNLLFVVPHECEQTAIVARLSAINHQIQTETAHLAKLRQEKQGLMQDLLTGRVPV